MSTNYLYNWVKNPWNKVLVTKFPQKFWLKKKFGWKKLVEKNFGWKKIWLKKKFWFFIKKKNLVLFFARKSEPLSARIGTVPIIARKSEPKKGYIEPRSQRHPFKFSMREQRRSWSTHVSMAHICGMSVLYSAPVSLKTSTEYFHRNIIILNVHFDLENIIY